MPSYNLDYSNYESPKSVKSETKVKRSSLLPQKSTTSDKPKVLTPQELMMQTIRQQLSQKGWFSLISATPVLNCTEKQLS